MPALPRQVVPEELDGLTPDDPRAQRSRRDLERIHRAMRSAAILRGALARLRLRASPRRIIELGSGDGSLLLRLARRLHSVWGPVELHLLDREPAVQGATLSAYAELEWRPSILCQDALVWSQERTGPRYDLCLVSLFLHHFAAAELRALLAGIALRCDAVVACEPERGRFALLFSHCVGVLGANAVTRGDAVKSVHAGFAGRELAAAWPAPADDWWLQEFRAWPFSHCFVAARRTLRRPEA